MIHLVRADLYRYGGARGGGGFLSAYFREPGFKFTFWLRACRYLRGHLLFRFTAFFVARFFYGRYLVKYGIQIPYTTAIGAGFYIGHFGCIVVNRRCEIGQNCNLSHEVTLGYKSRGENQGYPVIGDRVFIAPGAKIIGKVRVGNDVAIGANCVVTRDVPDNAVFVGIPGKAISSEGSAGYINDVLGAPGDAPGSGEPG